MSDSPDDTPAVGVQFPLIEGSRSTSAFGRRVSEAALAGVDPVGARAAAGETNWRSGYLDHFRRMVEAGLLDAASARRIATDGLAAVADSMRWVTPQGEVPLSELAPEESSRAGVARVEGSGEPITELSLPVGGKQLTGTALEQELAGWVGDGVIEPSVADSVLEVAANPEWLRLPGRTLVALGAGAEIGPTPTLLRWGATVAGIDLPRPEIWRRVIETAGSTAGTLLVPVRDARVDGADLADRPDLPARAGLDLLGDLPQVMRWVLDALDVPAAAGTTAVLGNYLYADGGTNVRVAAAGQALARCLRAERPDAVLAFLATPTDVFAVPADAVEQSVAAYESRSTLAKWRGRGLRTLSGGRLLQRNYRPGSDPGICDSLVPQQGPNYALGKRLHRWQAIVEAEAGRPVSMNVAPPTRTRSVVKNRALAAAYAGAHRFGVEVFEPATTRVLMAALLVHDLYAGAPVAAQPWQAEAHQAAHGGLWRVAYAPRSALGLAALLGVGAAR